jgi:uncharacterized protein (TIGR01777 family)
MGDAQELTGRVVIAGGSGFLGVNLARFWGEKGVRVTILSRRRPRATGEWAFAEWDARSVGDWRGVLDGAAAVVNLAGRTVDCIKSPDNCDEILRSRVEATTVLGQAMRDIENPPPVWVQMSTAHIYGDPPEVVCDEESPPGYGLAPSVGLAWEAAFRESVLSEQRSVVLRTSFVLGRSGGAFPKMKMMARLGLGGRAGHGRQGISWIHEADMNALFHRATIDDSMHGTYVATAPQPLSNASFMRMLRRVLKMPIGLPAAGWMIRIGARTVMRTDPELLLYGRYCVSNRLSDEGYAFQFADLESALRDLCG